MCFIIFSSRNNIYNHHPATFSPEGPPSPRSSKPDQEKDEEEPQTDEQGSYASDADVDVN